MHFSPLAAEPSPVYDLIFMHCSPLAAEPSLVFDLKFIHLASIGSGAKSSL